MPVCDYSKASETHCVAFLSAASLILREHFMNFYQITALDLRSKISHNFRTKAYKNGHSDVCTKKLLGSPPHLTLIGASNQRKSYSLCLKIPQFKNNYFDFYIIKYPVLYTVGQQATFWNMNSSIWAVWAVRAVREKNGFVEF